MRKLLLPGLGIAAAIALSGCDNNHKSAYAPSGKTSTVCGTYSGNGCAPASKRVDLALPSFSHSTEITNPLFPIGHGRSAVLLGHVDGKPFRTETTVLPGRQTVDWNGRRIPVLISQYMAYLDGRLDEVAIDRYAQADDGSVWYLGEDVFDYRKGAIAITEGTWLAGREGPAAMIMPARPKLGNVFRPENAIGIVFEEVTVTSVGKIVAGPRGPVAGAIVTKELHSDRTTEDKLFARRYGEFRTSGGGDLEALALEVPTDALPGVPPTELQSLSKGANGLLELSRIKEWTAANATIRGMNGDWATLQAGNPPPLIAARLTKNLAALTDAVKARKAAQTAQKAIDVSQSVLDLELRHRAQSTIDAQRFYLWTQQLRVDAAAEDLAGVTGDIAVLEWIRDRITERLGPAGREDVDSRLRALRGATDAKNLRAAADHAARLGARIRASTRA
ncbi:MAG: DUF3450 domain-containing protein [Actinomycetota bacterium]|nr:DUF3450 domain-containing protein [Actinomycetota bacterium]